MTTSQTPDIDDNLDSDVVTPKKVAILVPNICNPDYRVVKQAQSLTKAGYDVRIYAVKKNDLPTYETHNGVVYIRQTWNFARDIARYIFGLHWRKSEMEERRKTHMSGYNELMRDARDDD